MSSASSSRRRVTDRSEQIRLLVFELAHRHASGDAINREQILADHVDLMPELGVELEKLMVISGAIDKVDEAHAIDAIARLEEDWRRDPVSSSDTVDHRNFKRGGSDYSLDECTASIPSRIGRYHVLKMLGEGGFGQVVVARDTELQRDVAIKIPHGHRAADGETVDEYLDEARILAALDHPAIVPVYDAGRTEAGNVFVVSKLIEGEDLSARIKQGDLSHDDAVQLALTIAGALHYAHARGLVHRDIKPANILLNAQGRPFLADFGLALREPDPGQRLSYAGTPNYMSPEQARGEAHRVDCRSDIFSLGVVLYESLTGRKPFYSESYDDLLEQIRWEHPPALRHWDKSVSPELERVCLKAMAKRAADRYQNAKQLIDDLQRAGRESKLMTSEATVGAAVSGDVAAADGHDARDGGNSRIVPKGLRPFDANDAESYLALLPGPQDRTGLPECIRRWKHSIESTDLNESFAIGLLYGPSGSGKSSLVRAGILPRISGRVHCLYVEASPDDTIRQVVQSIGRMFPALNSTDDLTQCLIDIRRGQGPASGEKLLIVLDQFEQWIQGKTEKERRPLLEAMRQCDGDRITCLFSIRDDFWLAVSRFMADLEVDLVQGHNSALVDLFDNEHARYVLTEFGRSYGRLPPDPATLSTSQEAFLDRVVAGLAEEDRVVPVRLALFSEMVKEKPWTAATLRAVGGASGVGVAFLEESFSAKQANPQHRVHEPAVRAVLGALLPDAGSDVRGRIRSYADLLEISGYGSKPRLFKDLMRILDSETRLLTPMDPEANDWHLEPVPRGGRYYQLTHDYLVPSLREWLRTKQQSTRAGRARIRLSERSMLWNSRPERRQLPSLGEWLAIRLFTRPSHWSSAQRGMMRAATRRHALSGVLAATMLMTLLFAGVEISAFTRNLFMEIRARGAVVWMALGLDEWVWRLLKDETPPGLRTSVIHGLNRGIASPPDIVSKVNSQNDVSVRQAMILVAGEIGEAESVRERRSALSEGDPLIGTLLDLYEYDPDPGVHAASKWTLSKYRVQQELDRIDVQLQSTGPIGGRKWYVNGQGITLAVIPGPTEFLMGTSQSGSDRGGDEALHHVSIQRRYCIAMEETTVGQFMAFVQENPEIVSLMAGSEVRSSLEPQMNVSWYLASAYCNWLSKKEGLPRDQWCYEPDQDGGYRQGMRLVSDFLDRRGYRLPTEAEWEFACRAGTTTVRFFGDTITHLREYAVTNSDSRSSCEAVATKKPNNFGLFDVYGNVAEWNLDSYASYESAHEPPNRSAGSNPEWIEDSIPRVVRGGCCSDSPDKLRSAARQYALPDERQVPYGFRIARSLP